MMRPSTATRPAWKPAAKNNRPQSAANSTRLVETNATQEARQSLRFTDWVQRKDVFDRSLEVTSEPTPTPETPTAPGTGIVPVGSSCL